MNRHRFFWLTFSININFLRLFDVQWLSWGTFALLWALFWDIFLIVFIVISIWLRINLLFYIFKLSIIFNRCIPCHLIKQNCPSWAVYTLFNGLCMFQLIFHNNLKIKYTHSGKLLCFLLGWGLFLFLRTLRSLAMMFLVFSGMIMSST